MNLDTLPDISEAQAIIDRMTKDKISPTKDYLLWLNIRDIFPCGASAFWVQINDDWGLKVFYKPQTNPRCAEIGHLAIIEQHQYIYEVYGYAPYIHGKIEYVLIADRQFPAVFVQTAKQFKDYDYEGLETHPDYKKIYTELSKEGYWDFKPANMGIIDTRLVMIDFSHKQSACQENR